MEIFDNHFLNFREHRFQKRVKRSKMQKAGGNIRGFTLIEVLITLIVLSIGLLGAAGLEITSLRNTHSSYLRSQAVGLIDDMADRMRANMAGVDANQYANIQATPSAPDFDCMTDFDNTESAGTCSSNDVAEYDTYAWRTVVSQVLPSGAGTTLCTDSNDPDALTNGFTDGDNNGVHDTNSDGNSCTIGSTHILTVSWDDNRSGLADTNFNVVFAP